MLAFVAHRFLTYVQLAVATNHVRATFLRLHHVCVPPKTSLPSASAGLNCPRRGFHNHCLLLFYIRTKNCSNVLSNLFRRETVLANVLKQKAQKSRIIREQEWSYSSSNLLKRKTRFSQSALSLCRNARDAPKPV